MLSVSRGDTRTGIDRRAVARLLLETAHDFAIATSLVNVLKNRRVALCLFSFGGRP